MYGAAGVFLLGVVAGAVVIGLAINKHVRGLRDDVVASRVRRDGEEP